MPDPTPSAKQLANRLRIFRSPPGMNIEIPRELVSQVIDCLEAQDERVTGLIRACSTEVIKRRVFHAKLKVALAALQKAAMQFREYARQHRAKDTEQASLKAQTNDFMADQMDQAMIVEINPDDYGRA